ncbi:MAG: UDP-N-acetylmuramoyl-tripeptide--D-alanyl-D-alanine ligase [Actinomycetes bacterium]
MIPLTLAEIAQAVDGRLDRVADPTTMVTGPVVVDSRLADPGGLFVALPGEHTDGHEHAAAAVARGVVAVVVARAVGVPAVVVADPLVALGRLARAVRDRLATSGGGPVVVGITGSSGKTTTKDLLAHVLAPLGPVVAPPGSYNNEVGLPLTVLRADAGTPVMVLEMGARSAGHIRELTRIAPPRIGVVLNVGSAHLGEFGSRAAIARAKSELVQALPVDGLAVLGVDDPVVAQMAAVTPAPVLGFGQGGQAAVRAVDVELDARGRAGFRLVVAAGEATVHLRLVGEHQVGNALAAAAVAVHLGLRVDEVAERLSTAVLASHWRMEVSQRGDGVTVINDAYNANPESVRAALKSLVVLARGRRTWAVLGPMRELGAASLAEHDAIGRLVVRLNVERLVVVGEDARPVHLGASLEGSWSGESVIVPDVQAAVELLRRHVLPGDVVLVKASRAQGLEAIAEALLVEPTPGADTPDRPRR